MGRMKRFFVGTSFALMGMMATPVLADVRELPRDEIRASVRSGESMSLRQLKRVISTRVEGELVDVRAFEADGIVYRVLIKKSDGTLAVAVVDASSGRFLSGRSEVAKDVMAAAKANGGKGNARSAAAGGNANNNSSSGGGNGNSSSGGGNGNSSSGGGNGNSSSGGGNSSSGGGNSSSGGGNSSSGGGNSSSGGGGGNSGGGGGGNK